MKKSAIVVHGGAGTIRKSSMTTNKERHYKKGLKDAVNAGRIFLERGGSAIDAVATAVVHLENCSLFNAGKGSVFTAEGTHEMDAAIMDGESLNAGAITGVRGIKNPILLAKKVMTDSKHVFLSGKGAEKFAMDHGLEFESEDYFFDQLRYDQWLEVKDSTDVRLDHSISEGRGKDSKFGTVGAVAVDQKGTVAAATSTGGLTNKRYGRIGDSPVNGSGNYANNQTCAISCTGEGEFFLRGVAAYDISCLMEYKGMNLSEACDEVINHRISGLGGEGGVIGVDPFGNIALVFNSEGMYRGHWIEGQPATIAIYKR